MSETARSTYEQLYRAVHDDAQRNEIRARDYLARLIDILKSDLYLFVPPGSRDIVCIREDSGRSGRLDLAVVADVREGTEETRRKAFLWEIKAAQLHAFVLRKTRRAEPSKDLFQAENQLFRYHNDKLLDSQFLGDNGILEPDDVKLGGIIIGRFDRRIKAPFNADRRDIDIAFKKVTNLRRRYVYRQWGMELLTWTNILQRIKEVEPTYPLITDVFDGPAAEREASS